VVDATSEPSADAPAEAAAAPASAEPEVVLGPDGEPLIFFNAQWSRDVQRGMFLSRPRRGTIVPLVILTVIPALRARFDRHRQWARWTLPLWLYVSVTGVIVYLMLYIWWPSAEMPR
jgi:hypothetical protein